jgi:hypothetical protein
VFYMSFRQLITVGSNRRHIWLESGHRGYTKSFRVIKGGLRCRRFPSQNRLKLAKSFRRGFTIF